MRMTPNRWAALAIGVTALAMLASALLPQVVVQRTYWPVTIDSLAIGRGKHTHVEVRGQVVYVRTQDDGDIHIKLANPWRLGTSYPFVIAECIPQLPCAKPRAGSDVIVRGITRKDPEHGWWEIHPVESWHYATAGE